MHPDAPALRRAALLRDAVEVLLVDAPQFELLDRAACQKRRLYGSVRGVDSPPHLGQLGYVDRATIFCEVATKDLARPSSP